ncbi:excinuclease ABC subunit C [Thermoanaerobacterium thermosaccharolyticum]|uniref:UvrABC system protein C n=1 Tax=Thermoanaerobacterium thermosaccharolyticum TaxID=1517 RepID=A0A223I0E3_THETR|nr:excinuclease ABC subunit UvrC [Thermoanaerobacterium thermosaccharolyticum]AST58190.1 excinuclease ABC subunit C [Thermoanaerobacterium thermosaccharolyticum]PHO07175.1 excinuclease ABC subunit C [Thermoanaerobacterium thermosaccharolyticum]
MVNIEEKLKLLPEKPGVYIMKDSSGKIIYVGKAVILKNRVRQYFQNPANQIPKVRTMVRHIADFEYIVTDTELEALILECNLIKKHKPKYNILLKDDKNYPYIKITVNEDYPRILFTRRLEMDGAKYFGPYSSAFAVRETIKLLRHMFPLRSCNRNIEKDIGKCRECLYYHIGLCSAPCIGQISKDDYMKLVDDALMFLEGKHDVLLKKLKEEMEKASQNMEFEKAAKLRDQIYGIEKTSEKQKIISTSGEDQDVISMARSADDACIQVFFIRGGKVSGREHYFMKNTDEMNRSDIMSSFIKQFYDGAPYIPKEIITDVDMDEKHVLAEWLSNKRGNKVVISIPSKGKKKELVDMVYENALESLKSDINLKMKRQKNDAVSELSKLLGLEYAERIEAFDISNIRGTDNVASMVVFVDGKPHKSSYRKFNIKTVEGQDDYGSMREVILRRIKHGIEERKLIDDGELQEDKAKFHIMPDLILVDGGLGHVNTAKEVLCELNVDIPVYGMVKDSKHRTRGLVSTDGEIDMPMTGRAFRLVAEIQDEAHRFAITFHKETKSKKLRSDLLNIPGIGEKRMKALFEAFKTIDDIKNATVEELKKVEGMNEKAANAVYDYFRSD